MAPNTVPPPVHRCWWRNAAASLSLAIAGLVVLEAFFAACGVGMEEILQPDPRFGTRHIPQKLVIWRMEGYSADRFNSTGLRDDEHPLNKPPGTFRIALLGDSATEGLQVPLRETYGKRLEQLFSTHGLNTEVINFATSGYSTGQEVLQFESEVVRYKPDLTLLLYNRGDAVENIRKPTDFRCEPRPYFYLDGRGRLQEDDAILSLYRANLQDNALLNYLRHNSCIYGVFSHANLNLSMNEPLYRKLRGVLLSPFSPRLPSAKAAPAAYPLQDGFAVTHQLIRRLSADCSASGCKLAVVAFPNVVGDSEFDRQINALRKSASDDGFSFFDLTPAFHWHRDPMSLFLKYHFSAKGHDFVARQIAEFLRQSGY
jgi:hypothetical protein